MKRTTCSLAASVAALVLIVAPVPSFAQQVRTRKLSPAEAMNLLSRRGRYDQVKQIALAELWNDISKPDALKHLVIALDRLKDREQAAAFCHVLLSVLEQPRMAKDPQAENLRRWAKTQLRRLDVQFEKDSQQYSSAASGRQFTGPGAVGELWMTNVRADPQCLHSLMLWTLVGGRKDAKRGWIHNRQGSMHRSCLKLMDEVEGRKGVLYALTVNPSKENNKALAAQIERLGHRPRIITRNVGKCKCLRAGIKAYNFPLILRVEAEGRELLSQKVGADKWSDIKIDLQESAGKDVPVIVELLVPKGQRWHEGGWIDYLDFFDEGPRPYELAFCTYFGGSGGDGVRDVEVDRSGNIYVAGTTRSADFPTTPGAFNTKLDVSAGKGRWGYNSDIFVAKFSPAGQLIWSTLIGGPDSEEAYGLEIDSKECVVVHGRGARGTPVTKGTYQPEFKGCGGGDPGNPHNTAQNAYICKLTPDGSRMVWGSFFGIDHLHRDLALDKNDDIYTTWGVRPKHCDPNHWQKWMKPEWVANAFQKKPQGAADGGVAKIASDGSRVIWATYLGGSDYDSIEGCVGVDDNGFVYVGIQTRSKDLPTTEGAADRTHNGGLDWYVAKLKPDGSGLVYGTYVGDEGSNCLSTHNLVLDAQGNCYVTTNAHSAAFPTTKAAGRTRFCGGKNDIGIVKLSPTGKLLAGILLGGSGSENPEGPRINSEGNLVLFGQTSSPDFPVSSAAYQPAMGGDEEAFVVVLSPDLDRIVYSTFLGGAGYDAGRAGCVARDGSLIVAGSNTKGRLPTKNAFSKSSSGDGDAFVARLRRGE